MNVCCFSGDCLKIHKRNAKILRMLVQLLFSSHYCPSEMRFSAIKRNKKKTKKNVVFSVMDNNINNMHINVNNRQFLVFKFLRFINA